MRVIYTNKDTIFIKAINLKQFYANYCGSNKLLASLISFSYQDYEFNTN